MRFLRGFHQLSFLGVPRAFVSCKNPHAQLSSLGVPRAFFVSHASQLMKFLVVRFCADFTNCPSLACRALACKNPHAQLSSLGVPRAFFCLACKNPQLAQPPPLACSIGKIPTRNCQLVVQSKTFIGQPAGGSRLQTQTTHSFLSWSEASCEASVVSNDHREGEVWILPVLNRKLLSTRLASS